MSVTSESTLSIQVSVATSEIDLVLNSHKYGLTPVGHTCVKSVVECGGIDVETHHSNFTQMNSGNCVFVTILEWK